jgi:hypothetical protein
MSSGSMALSSWRGSRIPWAEFAILLALCAPRSAGAAVPSPGPPITIRKATGTITIDGDLSDAGWQGADTVRTWFETRVGDNVEPQVRNVGFLTYDDKFLYAGFVFDDPDPKSIRAPLGDHDAISGSLDYGGVIIDSRNDGKSAQMFLADPRGLQYDALTNDVSGEDSSPDYFWDCAGKITSTGWNLEIRIPFSSLRYGNADNPTMGILLYRNYPRDRHYQFFSARLPRDVNCFICNSSKLNGMTNLPHGSHLVVAPYGSSSQNAAPSGDLGSPLHSEAVDWQAGGDVKWNPGAALAIDGTINPDFSQIESDVAQISANERFALSYPEKRPFFLEGVDLLSTPLQAIYTRTITDPAAGLRATGRLGSTSYLVLGTQDAGGGLTVIPGAQGSDFALQDFVSNVAIMRLRHDLGTSYVSVLADTRQILDGGWNSVVGPDLNWRPKPADSFRGQFLWSESQTPNRSDLATEWNGQRLSDHAFQTDWSHSTAKVDWYLQGQDIGNEFRADNGFIPQVGYKEIFLDNGYTIRPKDSFISRQRLFLTNWVDWESEHNNRVLDSRNSFGTGIDGKLSTFIRVEANWDSYRVGNELLHRFRPRIYGEASPSRVINFVSLDTYLGDEIDFSNAREGTGATIIGTFSIRPTGKMELRGNFSRRWLDVNTDTGSGRLFVAEVERLRGTYSFNSRTFVRLIGQYQQTRRSPDLYTFAVDGRSAVLSGSALFAYKINWQTVAYLGYGNQSAYSVDTDDLEKAGWQWFSKVSYAWQR